MNAKVEVQNVENYLIDKLNHVCVLLISFVKNLPSQIQSCQYSKLKVEIFTLSKSVFMKDFWLYTTAWIGQKEQYVRLISTSTQLIYSALNLDTDTGLSGDGVEIRRNMFTSSKINTPFMITTVSIMITTIIKCINLSSSGYITEFWMKV